MIYVVVDENDRARGYYTERKMAQEHADYMNEHFPGKPNMKVITIDQKKDKKKAAHE